MKLKMRKIDAANVYGTINRIQTKNEKAPPKWLYFLSKNKTLLKSEVESIDETNRQTLKAYQEELVSSGAVKDSPNGTRTIVDADKVKTIDEKYKADLDASEAFLRSDTELDLHAITLDNVPELPAGFYDIFFAAGLFVESIE